MTWKFMLNAVQLHITWFKIMSASAMIRSAHNLHIYICSSCIVLTEILLPDHLNPCQWSHLALPWARGQMVRVALCWTSHWHRAKEALGQSSSCSRRCKSIFLYVAFHTYVDIPLQLSLVCHHGDDNMMIIYCWMGVVWFSSSSAICVPPCVY